MNCVNLIVYPRTARGNLRHVRGVALLELFIRARRGETTPPLRGHPSTEGIRTKV
ncbi:MAG: hypothetical protein LBM98_04570 [Oscillospiraceae bacterium]|nr:hypothetical protein [Oscillospiraceae bacterium]